MPRTTTFVVNVSIPAGAKAYQPIKAKIVTPESGVEWDEYQAERPLVIQDAYISASPSIDYLVRIVVNREKIAAVSRVPVSQLTGTNPAKPKAFSPSVGIMKGTIFSIEVIPLADNTGTTAVTHTLFLNIYLY